ncbi:beta-galactosidase [Coraliomargarita algicola]|uniref:Beta-galactosidase n=1 Tax=Coraliomargarita algicola TaxID=3092156 RepID=A0ABZ0RJB8_9BACT|nr:beta-galactosidase [Coraliomargarita sp. J2-16]WPJ95349.1 beta-galactosidase [Coraliomargarita sp. J2-16]
MNTHTTTFQQFPLLGRLQTKASQDIQSSRLGVGFETLDRNMWDVAPAWKVVGALGVKWARVQSGWARTETVAGQYNFEWLDAIIDPLIQRGIQPWLSLSYGNVLYTDGAGSAGVGNPPIYTEKERQGWKNYVAATVRHYQGRITHFEIWNEPDGGGFFLPKPHPKTYVELVALTATAIRKVLPDAYIIGGAFARAMTPAGLTFTRDCLECGMADWIDAVSYHGYKYMPEQYCSEEFPAYLRLLRQYKPTLAYWQGETGCPSKVPPGNTQAMAAMQVSEDIQARWLLRRVLAELSYDAQHVNYFNMGDFSHYMMQGELNYTCHYGLIRMEDGTTKPAYDALQSLATLLHDPLEIAAGRTSFRLEGGDSGEAITRAQASSAYQASFIRDNIPVISWWLREPVENETIWRSMHFEYWLDAGLHLESPVLIDPQTQNVYQLKVVQNQYGMNELLNLPISNTPLILTDHSLIEVHP